MCPSKKADVAIVGGGRCCAGRRRWTGRRGSTRVAVTGTVAAVITVHVTEPAAPALRQLIQHASRRLAEADPPPATS